MKIASIKHKVPEFTVLQYATMLRQSVLSQILPEDELEDYIES